MDSPITPRTSRRPLKHLVTHQALQVVTETSPASTNGESAPSPLAPVPPPPRVVGLVTNPPRRNSSSDTSTKELSPALLRAIQQIISAAILEQVAALAPARLATPSDVDVP
ncbi:UNVERIFIED_CONTAM: hypothetical protein Sradi_2095300 [Sesamum radiatum]|uniref:Uncharacterized protein n=1 Tax=Sesamum radiatum TaxID=300843 RepID=A0AAW2THX7_SESRA